MPRPRIQRRIFFKPDVTYFKPAGVPMVNLRETSLSFDELEAIRLTDSEGLDQIKCAKKMKISQSTLSRLLKQGRKKLSDAIIQGNAIKIQGGNFKMATPRENSSGKGLGGRGRMGGSAAGPSGNCICVKCGYEEVHKISEPCYKKKCPKCGSQMIRKQ